MRLQGWGRFPDIAADLIEPVSVESIRKSLKDKNKVLPLIPRGAGRSYGDSALATRVISTHFLDEFIAFDQTTQTIQCGSGMTLNAILKLIIPKGYFIPVLPGTKYISVGGAIAADIHGKNHHKYGSFCSYVSELSLMLASGEIEIAPLAFMRGRTLTSAHVIIDEAQNTTPVQMKMVLTRLGQDSRMVITGDLSQIDLPIAQPSGLAEAVSLLDNIKGVGIIHLSGEDVVRHPVVARILQAYEAGQTKQDTHK